MARPASTPVASTGTVAATSPAWQDRPSELMVMPMRAAEQHVLVVVGEADLHTAGQLRTQLIDVLQGQPPSVLVELGALEFCDLAGLEALHDAARAAHDAGIVLTFRGMSTQLAWLHRTFPPRNPLPLASAPGVSRPVPATPAEAARSTTTTATNISRPSDQNATSPRPPTNARPTTNPRAQAGPGTPASLSQSPVVDGHQLRTRRFVPPAGARRPSGAGRAERPERRMSQPEPLADQYLEVEQIVGRLARLALHAHALAERMDHPLHATVQVDPARPERIQRLRAGVDLARRALVAAARLDLDAICAGNVAGSWAVDRRRTERRASTGPKPAGPR